MRHTPGRHHPRRRVIQYSATLVTETRSCGVLYTPLEPVIGLAEGETRWRSMTVFASSPCARDDDPANPHRDKFCSRKFSAVLANTCMLARRSALPVSSVIADGSRPAMPMQLWPAA